MHAVLYIGTYDAVVQKLPVGARSGADTHHVRGGLCTVDDAEQLCIHAARAPLDNVTHLVVAYDRFMPQAQNMLLKSIEDTTHVRWYFIVARRDMLLPTIRSRLSEAAYIEERAYTDEVRDFLAMPYTKKLSFITSLYAKVAKSDEEKVATHRRAQAVVAACEARAHSNPHKYVRLAKDTLFVRKYLDQPGASPKMLLELLALSA
ncbi:hypothetical protein A3C87_02620 [Candidatus Kaiserbacteria bacterium RIFCSPHIGHO2_02_FULL_49_34]|uniref:DNA polymerase III delta N-terminal domain-containing protein n=1 Tax=Candidatus Kaiserbacteria bacterium RIFCSPHIGHO2_02_FULL_49_34 TaxID=1798491 RepID=A0A1F6DJN4_9BACT|nr:MAG: hypothetical protein A3C87_02620 [Candidatus Kaiserbacteria bacterium RIFCSPHIGHO2_02_FULL_49_34]